MLGNDIVDLKEVLSTRQARRPGYSTRIADPVEYSQLPSNLPKELKTWLLWAIKESAYKCYIQAGGLPIFAPKKLVFAIDNITNSLISGITQTPQGAFRSSIQIAEDFLLAESWSLEKDYENIIRSVEQLRCAKQQNQSEELRQFFFLHLSKTREIAIEDLQIKKNAEQVPHVFLGEEKLPYSLSLSHHGRFGLYSYYQENSPFLG